MTPTPAMIAAAAASLRASMEPQAWPTDDEVREALQAALEAAPDAQAEPVAWRSTDGEGGWHYRDDPPEEWQVNWLARYGRKHEPLYAHPPAPDDKLREASR